MDFVFGDPTIKAKGATVKFLRSGKVVFKVTGEDSHITLHPGPYTGVLDLHRTREQLPDDDPAKYETLGKISHTEFTDRLNAIGPRSISELLSLLRPIRLGWMIRRRLAIGPAFPPESVLPKITGIRLRSEQRGIGEPLNTLLRPPGFYEDVFECPGWSYLLFDWKKSSQTPYGVLFTYRDVNNHACMRWFKYRDVLRWAARWEPVFREALSPLLPEQMRPGER